MKPILFSICILFASVVFSKNTEKPVKSEIKNVTVFLSGAQVTSTASVSLPAGTTNVIFRDLTQYISSDNNMQVKAEGGDVTILSVVRKLNYMSNDNALPKELKALQDTLEALDDRTTLFNNMIEVYEHEEQMLIANNKDIGGINTGVNIAELEKAANLLRSRLMDIQTKKMDLQKKVKKIGEQYSVLQNQINELNTQQNKTTSEITVSVSSKIATSTKLIISYMVDNAGWAPYYDIRAENTDKPIRLEYKAHIWQNTGYDWDNVKINLSTGNPAQSSTQPKLTEWWVNITDPYSYRYNTQTSSGMGRLNTLDDRLSNYDHPGDTKNDSSLPFSTTSNYTTVTENQINTSFDISIPYSIPSDNKPYSVAIQDYNMPAGYKYFSVPKMDKDAFLLARINSWEQYNLMSADANIYYEGMYIGTSFINTRNTSDTLDISLGRDKNVVVTRVKLQNFSEKKIIGANKKETYTFEITVRNNKKQSIEIVLEDQIPVSQNSEIEVELLDSSDAEYNEEIGKLSWPLNLVPGETKKIKLTYSVKYPKDKLIANL
jgi:uncharacterized protein (TIGR02231 family)